MEALDEGDSGRCATTPMSHSRSSTPMVSSDSEHPICRVSVSSVLGSSSVLSKGTDCRKFSPPCGSPSFSPVITAKSGVHQGGGFSQELLPQVGMIPEKLSDSLSEECATLLWDFFLWYHFDFCSLRSNTFNSALNSRRWDFRATISSERLSHNL